MPQRINKLIATNLGVSRREADLLLAQGKVLINGKKAEIGQQVGEQDEVLVNQKKLRQAELIYIALNKPVGYVSSRRGQNQNPTLYELLPKEYRKLKTVGRLDKNSEGLILLTNDGDFAFRMTHPKFVKQKEYEAELDRPLEPLHQQMLTDFGVQLSDGVSKLGLEKIDDARKKWRVIMSEGRNRQIRRSFGALGYTVIKLKRISFGRYNLGNLASGKWQKVPKVEN